MRNFLFVTFNYLLLLVDEQQQYSSRVESDLSTAGRRLSEPFHIEDRPLANTADSTQRVTIMVRILLPPAAPSRGSSDHHWFEESSADSQHKHPREPSGTQLSLLSIISMNLETAATPITPGHDEESSMTTIRHHQEPPPLLPRRLHQPILMSTDHDDDDEQHGTTLPYLPMSSSNKRQPLQQRRTPHDFLPIRNDFRLDNDIDEPHFIEMDDDLAPLLPTQSAAVSGTLLYRKSTTRVNLFGA